jgi:microcystin-dependent protein
MSIIAAVFPLGMTGKIVEPIGSIVLLASSTVPTGYLECNGAAISRTTYATLFAVLGTTWGAGDGSTTFNLPDLRGEFIKGSATISSGLVSQDDAIVNMTGTITVVNQPFLTGSGVFSVGGATTRYQYNSNPITQVTYMNFDASRWARTSTENRARNKAVMCCVRYT